MWVVLGMILGAFLLVGGFGLGIFAVGVYRDAQRMGPPDPPVYR